MNAIDSVALEVADTTAAARFYDAAFGLDPTQVRLRGCDAPTTGFRGFTLSLVVSQPGNVDALLTAAHDAGATVLKPAAKSLWGYGGVVQAPDGTVWQLATSVKKDTGPVTRDIDELVLLLGVEDVKDSKRFYVEQGFTVGKSFGGKYVEFVAGEGAVKLSLYKRRALAKVAGVPAGGTGSHRLVLSSAAGPFTDPDGFVCEATAPPTVTDPGTAHATGVR
ncbi:glyoxalase [Streptomyces sp. NPDC093586]|uniref:glyoxalase n=1 Tax=Streptomyces sp. NPDC093586 TaxID=3366042 RepID=UPI00380EB6DF